MPLTSVEKLILHALGQFYLSLNQSLIEKPVRVRTSKIAFVELMAKSSVVSKQERALYKNLESLQKKRLIKYESHLIQFTPKGLKQLEKIQREIRPFVEMQHFFRQGGKTHRKLQTVMDVNRF